MKFPQTVLFLFSSMKLVEPRTEAFSHRVSLRLLHMTMAAVSGPLVGGIQRELSQVTRSHEK